MLSPCSHEWGNPSFWEILMNCRWVHQPPPRPLHGLLMNSCFGTCFHSSFPDNLMMSSCQLCHLFLLRHPESEVSWPQSDLNLGWIWWLEHFPRVITLVFIWPGKMMSCLAHLAGGPIVIVSFSARLSILAWGNCKTYSISCSWWILCVSIAWSLPMTMSMLSRRMSMVLQFSTRTFKAQC